MPHRPPHLVAAAVQHGNHPFELAVACEVFGLDRPELGVRWYDFVVCSEQPRVDLGPFTIEVRAGLEVLDAADTIIIPAQMPDLPPSPALLRALQDAYARGARLMSFCSGAFTLAAAGVLDGKRATTHWMYAARLAAEYPAVDVVPDVLYVDTGQVLTSAGTAGGIDLSLHVVRCDFGAAIANQVARRMVMPPHRDGGQAQFVDQPVPERDDINGLGPTLDWILDNLAEPLTVEHMASHALMSCRTFMRRFRASTGTTPMRWLLQQRVARARHLLETTDLPIDRVASACGFGTAANLRVHFTRSVGTSPSAYRRTFAA